MFICGFDPSDPLIFIARRNPPRLRVSAVKKTFFFGRGRHHDAAAGGGIEVAIRDSGGGVPDPPADVFQPFFSTKPNGLGMGLSISRSIIEAHGGRLWAARNADHGSTFHFTLPVETVAAS